MHRAPGGFSLIELALVLALIGIMAGGFLGSVQARIDNQRYRETEQTLALLERALLGFAVAHGARLPCPDADGDGAPDADSAGRCIALEGGAPWALLGVGRFDAWGGPLRYRPDRAFVNTAGLGNPPNTMDGLRIADVADGASLTLGNPHGPAAVIFSCGRNRVADGANAATDAAGSCNAGGHPDAHYEHGRPGARFDDVLAWVSKNVVLAYLVDAGVWPP